MKKSAQPRLYYGLAAFRRLDADEPESMGRPGILGGQ